jgi:hypothetical protein
MDNNIDTEIDNYHDDELLQILELEDPTAEAIRDKVGVMMRQYPSIAFFFAQVGERLEQTFATNNEAIQAIDTQQQEEEANVWLKNQYLKQDGSNPFNTYTSRDNKVQIFEDDQNNHDQMKRERLGAVDVVNVPVSQGTLNPILKNITSRIVMLDSAYRQNIIPYDSPVAASTDYTLDLSDTLNNTLSLKLSSVQIPYTWYNIAGYLGNSCFGYILNPATDDLNFNDTFFIPNNLYLTASDIVTALNTNSTHSGSDPNLAFSLTGSSGLSGSGTGNYFTIKNTGFDDIRLVFYNGNNPNMNCNPKGCRSPCKLDNNLGWVLGFRSTNIQGLDLAIAYDILPGGTITADVPYTNVGPTYFLLVIDDFNQNHLNQGLVNIDDTDTTLNAPSYIDANINYSCFTSTSGYNSPFPVYIPNAPTRLTQAQLYSANQILENRKNTTSYRIAGPTTTDVLAVIPLKVGGLSFGEKYVEFGSSLLQNERVYFGPVNISRMRVTLRDDKGNVVNLNGADWSFSLISTHLYEF